MTLDDRHLVRPVPTTRRPTILAVADEWFSAHGGLSTFNRMLCIALAEAGALVCCVLPQASSGERRHAAVHGVTLIQSRPIIGGTARHALIRRPALPTGMIPDAVLGHGRVTGPDAVSIAEDYYPSAAYLHIVHVAPDELEWWRTGLTDDVGLRAEQRTRLERELCTRATTVFAVGPRLHQLLRRDLSVVPGSPQPLRLDPGFDSFDFTPRQPPPGSPRLVLLMGRLQDYEIKGVDLAARALAYALDVLGRDGLEVEMLIRGAPPGESAQLRARVQSEAGNPAVRATARPFSVETESLRQDLMRATLVLMPSRAESFGLVGVEAIAAGTPLLASSRSGLGMALAEFLPWEQAHQTVVPVSLSDVEDIPRWGARIAAVLGDPAAAFTATHAARSALVDELSWRRAALQVLDQLLLCVLFGSHRQ